MLMILDHKLHIVEEQRIKLSLIPSLYPKGGRSEGQHQIPEVNFTIPKEITTIGNSSYKVLLNLMIQHTRLRYIK